MQRNLADIYDDEQENALAEFKEKYESYFTEDDMRIILYKLSELSPREISSLSKKGLKDPKLIQISSIFLGVLGVDQFIMGKPGRGLLKLFTAGGFGVGAFYDIFTAKKNARNYNYNKMADALHIDE